MMSLGQLEDLLKEEGSLEEDEARRILNENATSGELFRDAAKTGYLNVVRFLLEAKDKFELMVEEELMCYNSVAVDTDLNTPLHLAAANGHGHIVEYIISSGEKVDVENRYEETPLDLACNKGHDLIVGILIQHGASVFNVFKGYNKQPIEVAALNGHAALVRRLIDSGSQLKRSLFCAAEKGRDDVVAILLQQNENPYNLDRFDALKYAAANGHVRLCEKLLNDSSNNIILFDYLIKSIKVAAKHGHIDVVKLLLSYGASLGGTVFSRELFSPNRNSQEGTAIDLAVMEGHIAIAGLLLSHGCSLDKRYILRKMIEKGRLLAVLSLIAMGEDLNSIDQTTMIHLACHGKLEMVQFVLQRGVSVNTRDCELNTPLHTACRYSGDESIVRYLISKGAQLNAMNKEGETPLHVATHFHLQKALIEKGADPNMPCDDGKTVLHLAKTVELAELLLQNNVLVDARTKAGETPLMNACKNCHRDVVALLLNHGASVNCVFRFKYSPLLISVLEKRHDIVELLVENNVNVNFAPQGDGETALFKACRQQDVKSALLLLKNGAKVNAKNVDKCTPLHYAVMHDSAYLVQLLLKSGAHINAVNITGRTAFHFVKTVKIAKLLLEAGADASIRDRFGQTPLDMQKLIV